MESAQKLLQESLRQIAEHPERNYDDQQLSLNVHDIAFANVRERTAQYLKKHFPAVKRPHLMDRLEYFVTEALFSPDIQEQIEIAKTARDIECQAVFKRRNLTYHAIKSTQEIIKELKERYIPYLQKQYHLNTTFSWDILESLLNRIDTLDNPADKEIARNTLIRTIDDARAAYDLEERKYVNGTDFSCLKGLAERLLDHHQLLVPEIQSPPTLIENTIQTLISPFAILSEPDIEYDGVQRHFYTPLLYQLYADAAGYRIQTKTKKIFKLKDNIDIENLLKTYLKSIESKSVSAKAIECQKFNTTINQLKKNLLEPEKDNNNPIAIFLNQEQALREDSYTETTLIPPIITKTEQEILDAMILNGPFIDRAHIQTVLAWHDPKASTETMHNSLLHGLEPSFTGTVPSKESMILAYESYIQNQRHNNSYFQFDFMHASLSDILVQGGMMDFPCSQTVLCAWLLQNIEILELTKKEKLAILCVKQGYASALRILIKDGVDLNYTELNENFITLAIEYNHAECIRTLAELGFDLNAQDKYGETHLMYAVNYKKEALQALIDAGVNLNSTGLQSYEGRTALMIAAARNEYESVKILIDAGANLDFQNILGHCALMEAAENRSIEALQVCIDSGANLDLQDRQGCSALMRASMKGLVNIVETLIKAGARLDLKNKNNHTVSVVARPDTILNSILRRAFNDCKSDSRLMTAAKEGAVSECRTLICSGANMNSCNQDGYTVLDMAIIHGHLDVIKFIVKKMNLYRLMKSICFAVEHQQYHYIVPQLFIGDIARTMLLRKPDAVEWAQKHSCSAAVNVLRGKPFGEESNHNQVECRMLTGDPLPLIYSNKTHSDSYSHVYSSKL